MTKKLNDCRKRLAQYRAALDQGADPALVAGWISETVQVEQETIAALEALPSERRPRDATAIREMVLGMGEMVTVLREADPRLKGEVYSSLGLRLVYRPDECEVQVLLSPPSGGERVGGGT